METCDKAFKSEIVKKWTSRE